MSKRTVALGAQRDARGIGCDRSSLASAAAVSCSSALAWCVAVQVLKIRWLSRSLRETRLFRLRYTNVRRSRAGRVGAVAIRHAQGTVRSRHLAGERRAQITCNTAVACAKIVACDLRLHRTIEDSTESLPHERRTHGLRAQRRSDGLLHRSPPTQS